MAISPKALHRPNPWNLPAIASSGDIGAAGCDPTAENLKEIDSALTEFKVHGGRMNEQQMQIVEADGIGR
jgi:hypothetical protein